MAVSPNCENRNNKSIYDINCHSNYVVDTLKHWVHHTFVKLSISSYVFRGMPAILVHLVMYHSMDKRLTLNAPRRTVKRVHMRDVNDRNRSDSLAIVSPHTYGC